jgi:hypothetical protein
MIGALIGMLMPMLGCQSPPQRFSVLDRAAIQQALDSMAASASRANWAQWSEFFDEDARLFAWGAHCVGPDAIASYLRSRPPAVAFDLGPAAVHGDAGLAYAWSPVFVGYQGDQVDTSHQIVILRKNAAGRWRIRLVTLVGSSGNAGATRIATANVMALKRQEDDACPPIPR